MGFGSTLQALGKEPKVPANASQESKVLLVSYKIERGGFFACQKSSSWSIMMAFLKKEVHRTDR